MVSLRDITRYSFDNCTKVSGKDLEVAGDLVTLEDATEAFKKVTGLPTVTVHVTIED